MAVGPRAGPEGGGLDLSFEGWTGFGLWGWKIGGENISGRGNSWSKGTRMGSGE